MNISVPKESGSMRTDVEWARAVCDEGARVHADHQKLIDALKVENERLRAVVDGLKRANQTLLDDRTRLLSELTKTAFALEGNGMSPESERYLAKHLRAALAAPKG